MDTEFRMRSSHDPEQPADAAALADDLRPRIEGEVRFDDGSRALYATDGSNYRQVPIGVVVPRTERDVIRTLEVCRRHGAPILARGGGTSLAGQCCNVAVVLDFSKYLHRVIELNARDRYARVQPGCNLDDLRNEAERHNLTFGPDPATHAWNTLGGMIGNNSCGVHSVMAGRTSDNVEQLTIVTYDGLRMTVGKTSDREYERIVAAGGRRAEIYRGLRGLVDRYAPLIRERFPRIPRRVSGYNLPALLPENGFHVAQALVGSECTCVMILEAQVKLVHSPPARSLVVIGFVDIFTAADHVPQILEFGPVGMEGMDDQLVNDIRRKHLHPQDVPLLPDGQGWLLVEFGGDDKQASDDKARRLMEALRGDRSIKAMKLYDDPPYEKKIWELRESGLGATAHIPGAKDNWEGWEDSAVRREDLGDYLRDFSKLLGRYDYKGCLYGHFGDACLHTRIDFDLRTADGIRKWRRFLDDASDLVMKYGGSFSGEHGDGQSRAELLPKMFGEELIQAFDEFKTIWDPDGKMNPGKLVKPFKIVDNLRYGTAYDPKPVETHFAYPSDRGSFIRATERCVGASKCRTTHGGTMCPSYMATREERHSTRGRAHLLFEMLQGEVIADGWQSEEVKEALDLCLACKGCKGECPVHVDMATLKAEFLSHYYEKRRRPVHAYAFGWIHRWARVAELAPRLVNLVTQTWPFRTLAKAAVGMAPQRTIPRFAPQTFKRWFALRDTVNPDGDPVILWADTFNDHFYPEILKAAVYVLEDAGFSVRVPQGALCCGRPLYDYGFLDQAKRMLADILDELRDEIEQGIPVVGLEPSCVAVFRDELCNLMTQDQQAQRLRAQAVLLSELLARKATHYKPPRLARKAVVHGHCHHKSLMRMTDEVTILKKMGVDLELLDSGCCGMAGAFGFEEEHYDISVAIGERVLLPKVRALDDETLIIADGFSCREQVLQTTGRRPLHLAEVMAMGLGKREPVAPRPTVVPSASLLGALAVGAAAAWFLTRRSSRRPLQEGATPTAAPCALTVA